MEPKIVITISSTMSGAILVALFLLRAIMPGVAEHWVNQGADLNAAQKILIGVAAFLSKLSWSEWALVIGSVFSFVAVIALLQRAFLKGRLKLASR